MRRVLILLFLCLLTGQAARLGRAERGWVAGVAEGKITPPVGTHLIGFEARPGPSKGVHDDLYVRALVVEQEVLNLAIVWSVVHNFHDPVTQQSGPLALAAANSGLNGIWFLRR